MQKPLRSIFKISEASTYTFYFSIPSLLMPIKLLQLTHTHTTRLRRRKKKHAANQIWCISWWIYSQLIFLSFIDFVIENLHESDDNAMLQKWRMENYHQTVLFKHNLSIINCARIVIYAPFCQFGRFLPISASPLWRALLSATHIHTHGPAEQLISNWISIFSIYGSDLVFCCFHQTTNKSNNCVGNLCCVLWAHQPCLQSPIFAHISMGSPRIGSSLASKSCPGLARSL